MSNFENYKNRLLEDAASAKIYEIKERVDKHFGLFSINIYEVQRSMGLIYEKEYWESIDFIRWLTKSQKEVKFLKKILGDDVWDGHYKKRFSQLKQASKKYLIKWKPHFPTRLFEHVKEEHWDEIDGMFKKVLES